jgi:hypothetical protein
MKISHKSSMTRMVCYLKITLLAINGMTREVWNTRLLLLQCVTLKAVPWIFHMTVYLVFFTLVPVKLYHRYEFAYLLQGSYNLPKHISSILVLYHFSQIIFSLLYLCQKTTGHILLSVFPNASTSCALSYLFVLHQSNFGLNIPIVYWRQWQSCIHDCHLCSKYLICSYLAMSCNVSPYSFPVFTKTALPPVQFSLSSSISQSLSGNTPALSPLLAVHLGTEPLICANITDYNLLLSKHSVT